MYILNTHCTEFWIRSRTKPSLHAGKGRCHNLSKIWHMWPLTSLQHILWMWWPLYTSFRGPRSRMKREQAILSPCMLEGNTEPVKGARAGSEFLVTSYKFSPLCFLGMGHFYPRFNSISHFPPLIRQLSPWSNSTLTVKVYFARQFGSCSKAKKGKQINHTSKNFQELPPVL